jgi:hypothetical protein
MNGPVSMSLWIYFALMVPLTVVIVGAWWYIDQHTKPEVREDPEVSEKRLSETEARVIDRLRKTTQARFRTWDLNQSRQ